ncbi:hypothetical protein [Natrinema caseinilyticum]|nr:hypothetical protein [Natrinema caseinilyticum]
MSSPLAPTLESILAAVGFVLLVTVLASFTGESRPSRKPDCVSVR